MEFWDEKARPAILVAVKAACEAVREDLAAGSFYSGHATVSTPALLT